MPGLRCAVFHGRVLPSTTGLPPPDPETSIPGTERERPRLATAANVAQAKATVVFPIGFISLSRWTKGALYPVSWDMDVVRRGQDRSATTVCPQPSTLLPVLLSENRVATLTGTTSP